MAKREVFLGNDRVSMSGNFDSVVSKSYEHLIANSNRIDTEKKARDIRDMRAQKRSKNTKQTVSLSVNSLEKENPY